MVLTQPTNNKLMSRVLVSPRKTKLSRAQSVDSSLTCYHLVCSALGYLAPVALYIFSKTKTLICEDSWNSALRK